MLAEYNHWLVLVSICVASLASYTALDLASRITASRGRAARTWLVGGAISMGTGIWSMHFIGMLAVRLPIPLGYEWLPTLASLAIAIVVSFFALFIASQRTLTWRRLASSGVTMGLGIVSMHYVGMAAIDLVPSIAYDAALVGASVAIAIGASTAALWTAFRLRGDSTLSRVAKMGSGIIMGLAIYGMHYTAMAAANFAPGAICLSASIMDTPVMAAAVTLFTVLLLLATLLVSLIDAKLSSRTAAMSASLTLANEEARAKDEFLAMLAHELRNPLAAISNAAHLLDAAEPGGDSWRFAREVIGRQSAHLTRMIDDLLDVGRLVSGKISLELRPLELNRAVEQALSALGAARRLERHEVRHHGQPVWVNGDPTRIEQIIANLVGNAITYTPPGGRIAMSVTREGADAVLIVRDTGTGMTREIMPRIFDLFFQERRGVYRSTGGLGIGLTVVQRLVQLHGGTVRAHSDGTGKGSELTVRIPAVQAEQRAPVAAAAPRTVPGRRLVIVEDDTDALETLRLALELEGHSVMTAADGLSGLQRIEENDPEIGIIDIGLPQLDGYDLAQRLRSRNLRTFLIALTGYGTPDDRHRALRAGFDAHMTKPADLAKLSELIGHAPARSG
jgi:NO-binding membrane sensor protein with MHYT domain/CheY-like chemotaxis protein